MVDDGQRQELERAIAAVRRAQATERAGMGIALNGPDGDRFVQWTEVSRPGMVHVEVGVDGLRSDQLAELTALGFEPFDDDRLQHVLWARAEPFPAAELEHLVTTIVGVYELDHLDVVLYPDDLVAAEDVDTALPSDVPASGNGQVEGLPRPPLDVRLSAKALRQLLDELPSPAADALVAGARPAVVFATRRLQPDEPVPAGISRFGGVPDLPDDRDWPIWRPGGSGPSRPLMFFAQIALSEVAPLTDLPLPDAGVLSFFSDFDGSGGVGLYADDRDGSRVLHLPGGLTPRATPESLPVLAAAVLQPIVATTIPEPDDIDLDDDGYDAYDAAEQALRARVAGAVPPGWTLGGLHQLGGHPRSIQNWVGEEAVQAARGVYRRSGGFDHVRWEAVRHEVADWRLLLQLDSDEALEVLWGDAGSLYWVAPLDRVSARDWDEVRFVFQCH